MEHDVDVALRGIRNVGVLEREIRRVAEVRQVGEVPGDEVVDAVDAVAVGQQAAAEVVADESRTPRDEDPQRSVRRLRGSVALRPTPI